MTWPAVLRGVELSLSEMHAVATVCDALQGRADAGDADASEVEEEAASGSNEEEISSESGGSEFEDEADKAKPRIGTTSNSTCFSAAYLMLLCQVLVQAIYTLCRRPCSNKMYW